MIVLTRLNGSRFGINDEQIERLEEGHDTVVVLVTGNRYTVQESLDQIIEAIVDFRAKVLSTTEHLDSESDVRKRHHASLSVFHSPTQHTAVPDSGDEPTKATITNLQPEAEPEDESVPKTSLLGRLTHKNDKD